MTKAKLKIINESGLHARPAADFVKAATGFKADITIRSLATGDEASAKSIVKVLMLGLGRGSEVELSAEGPDEAEAIAALTALFEAGFGEGA
ncbi:MAG: HPr family phosphocarrier protein [Oscillospiraceae bacterium]